MTLTFLRSYLRTKYRRQFRGRLDLQLWQERKMQRHLKTVLPLSPFYAQRLSADNWRSAPLLDKSLMMEHFDSLNTVGITKTRAFQVALASEESRDFSPMIESVAVGLSSGTSGNRGLFLASPKERQMWAGTLLAKCLPGPLFKAKKIALVLRANNTLYTSLNSRRIQFRFFDLMDPLDEIVEKLKSYQPDILAAPPSILLHLGSLRPSRVISIAEVLDPLDAFRLRDLFGQTIHQIYQATEGFLGTTCSEGTLHLNEDLLVVQKEWVPGEERTFVPIISDFFRTTQPIIRYRLNDLLTEAKTPCACGSIMTSIERIQGRCDDMFYLPALEGSSLIPISPDFISRSVICASEMIIEYQATQEELDHVRVAFTCPDEFRGVVERRIRDSLNRLFIKKGCVPPRLTFSKGVPEASSVKMRRVRCDLK